MESPEDDQFVSDLAEAIADGRPVAWADLPDQPGADDANRLKQFQVLEAVAALHRSPDAAGTTPADPAAPGRPRSGASQKTWGGFELIEQIGQGSFGVVYRARDVRLDRDVALKLLTRGNDGEQCDRGADEDPFATARLPGSYPRCGETLADRRSLL